MEEKKSLKANLDVLRPRAFILGVVVALSLVFVGLEYSVEPEDPLDDAALQERLWTDAELTAFLKPENEVALAPLTEEKPVTELKVVEELTEEELRQEESPLETDASEDMEPVDEVEDEVTPTEEEQLTFRVVQDLPQFPGGLGEFAKWLTRHLKYPKVLESKKVEGKVLAEFMVNTDGSVTDVTIVSSLHPLCDQEVLRVLRLMPRWTPGIENDQPCRTKVCVPVVFRL